MLISKRNIMLKCSWKLGLKRHISLRGNFISNYCIQKVFELMNVFENTKQLTSRLNEMYTWVSYSQIHSSNEFGMSLAHLSLFVRSNIGAITQDFLLKYGLFALYIIGINTWSCINPIAKSSPESLAGRPFRYLRVIGKY